MKIAFISAMAGYPWGGSEILWSQAAQRLLAEGHEVLVSVKKWPALAPAVRDLEAQGAVVVEREFISASRSKFWRARLCRKHVVHPGYEPSWEALRSFEPDLVCISHGGTHCGSEWMLRCHRDGIPYASISQANFEQWWPEDGRRQELVDAFDHATKAFFVSKGNRDLYERQLGKRLVNAEVIWNPFNVAWDAAPNWPQDDALWHLACVGRLDPRAKGQDLILEVLSMPKWRQRPLKISLYGRGEREQSILKLAEMLGVQDQIRFVGHVDDVAGIWEENHGLILSSRYEGLPLCLVEAMLCGRIAITTDVAGNAEPIEDNVTGFVAEAPTAKHLDEAMERAWQRRHEWEAMGAAAAASIRTQIPKDPAQVFAVKLLTLAENSHRSADSSTRNSKLRIKN